MLIFFFLQLVQSLYFGALITLTTIKSDVDVNNLKLKLKGSTLTFLNRMLHNSNVVSHRQ